MKKEKEKKKKRKKKERKRKKKKKEIQFFLVPAGLEYGNAIKEKKIVRVALVAQRYPVDIMRITVGAHRFISSTVELCESI